MKKHKPGGRSQNIQSRCTYGEDDDEVKNLEVDTQSRSEVERETKQEKWRYTQRKNEAERNTKE